MVDIYLFSAAFVPITQVNSPEAEQQAGLAVKAGDESRSPSKAGDGGGTPLEVRQHDSDQISNQERNIVAGNKGCRSEQEHGNRAVELEPGKL